MMDHGGRIAKLQGTRRAHGLDALLVTNLTNVRYLTGFSGTNGQVLVRDGGASFFSDPRYEARAADLVEGAEIVIYPTKLTDLLPDHLDGVARLGVEAGTMTLLERDQLAEALGSVELVPTKNAVEDLRRIKEEAEVAKVREAVSIGDAAFSWVVDHLAPGATERSIALELEVWMRRAGADHVSFEPIVGSGPLSAHIHHTPSDRPFDKGDLVLLDFGARIGGYCSDLTRTVVLGPATDDQRALYDIVLAAQQKGIDAVAAGVPCAEVDAVARSYIDSAGHGDAFAHGLGHGVGLDIHEAPRVHRTSEEKLVEGDVVTIEPGIYLRDEGGMRIEDCVLVTSEGADVLSAAPKDRLIEL
jgi:Xaa-Pro aminopeptidase